MIDGGSQYRSGGVGDVPTTMVATFSRISDGSVVMLSMPLAVL
jgi:hypothetical protein